MKTRTIVILGLAVALTIGLSSTVAYAMMWIPSPYSRTYAPGAYRGYGGMMGGGYGMGMMSGYSGGYGMMGQFGGHCGWGYGNYSTQVAQVAIVNYAFAPSIITVPRGTTVTWFNMDWVEHTVDSGTHEAPTDIFESGPLGHMGSFSYTFNTPGTYTYHCDPHPYMTGTVIVTD